MEIALKILITCSVLGILTLLADLAFEFRNELIALVGLFIACGSVVGIGILGLIVMWL